MKTMIKALAIGALLAGGANPVAAQSPGLNDAICIQVLGETAAKLKDKQSTHAVVMNFQGYYTARIRAALGSNDDIAATMKAGREAVAKMTGDQYKAAGSKCLDGAAQKDLEELFVFNDQLGANPPESR
ncbi:MAG: hypothetical protein K2W91_03540 [Novosphingobium sp.]|nr:hypothetical protein [Novosphingobium sp.]